MARNLRVMLVAGVAFVCLNAGATLNDQVAQLDIDTARLADVIEVFGHPAKYYFDQQEFVESNLPEVYLMQYYNGFDIFMQAGWILEYRFYEGNTNYTWQHGLRVGSSLNEVIAALGQPAQTVTGQTNEYEDGILYRDIDGTLGRCYYRRADLGVRFFFSNYNIVGLYVTRSDFGTFEPPESELPDYFDDVRHSNLSALNMSSLSVQLLHSLTFDTYTEWPSTLPAGFVPADVIERCKNPGLGVRALHARGITGSGVKVAIIDQPAKSGHAEYAGKIATYYDVGTGQTSTMHGPAVASLLVGTNCGTAPGASLYFAAAPSWNGDTAYYALALDWIIAQNAQLPAGEQIRVVSVSAAPSGTGSPFTAHQEMWDAACARAEAAGLVVLDCTQHRGLIGPCWYDPNNPEAVAACTPGFPGSSTGVSTDRLLAPCSQRTTAEHYGNALNAYSFWGKGGLSWSIPYVSGVLALGWQVHPAIGGQEMVGLLRQSAHVLPGGQKIIDPQAFIDLVERQVECREPYFLVPGASLHMSAAETGSGYQWYKDGNPLSDDGRITGAHTFRLDFAEVEEEDSGTYTCVFTNGGKSIIETEPYVLQVEPGSLPVGMAAVLMMVAGIAILGVSRMRVRTS